MNRKHFLSFLITACASGFKYGISATDARATDLQEMLDSPDINAILCARGGYGLLRIIDRLN